MLPGLPHFLGIWPWSKPSHRDFMGGGRIAQHPPGVDLHELVSGDTIPQNRCPQQSPVWGLGGCSSFQETSSGSKLTTLYILKRR